MTEFFLLTGGSALLFMVCLWIVSLVLRDVSIVDIFWGPGFVLVAWVAWTLGEVHTLRGMVAALLTTVWGVRLGLHIGVRNIGSGEDRRYRAMREKGGTLFPFTSLFKVFLLQGVLMFIISLPVQIVQVQPGPSFGILLVIGAIIWLTGFFFEALGDEQLRRFLSDPENRGKVMDRGLWRYTRHPNYFGESLIWWGLFIIALPVSGGWITIIGPLAITFLLLRVSGVTLLEKDLEERRPEYRDYVRRTSPFIPLPPRKE
jgi:steroid 5-alpha reductase family enzyme